MHVHATHRSKHSGTLASRTMHRAHKTPRAHTICAALACASRMLGLIAILEVSHTSAEMMQLAHTLSLFSSGQHAVQPGNSTAHECCHVKHCLARQQQRPLSQCSKCVCARCNPPRAVQTAHTQTPAFVRWATRYKQATRGATDGETRTPHCQHVHTNSSTRSPSLRMSPWLAHPTVRC
jgi:hypothetical protein